MSAPHSPGGVGRYGNTYALGMRRGHEILIVVDSAVAVRILEDCPEHLTG